MDTSRVRAQLIHHEGMPTKNGRCYLYDCPAGKKTIGVGRNVEDRGISTDEAFVLLDNDIADCITDLQCNMSFFAGLDDVRKAVLINMCYNLGISRLMKFKNTIAAIKDRNWNEAAIEMVNSNWADQVGVRAKELSRMMATGEWT